MERRVFAIEKQIEQSRDPVLQDKMRSRLQLAKNELAVEKTIWEDVSSGKNNHQMVEARVILYVGVGVADGK